MMDEKERLTRVLGKINDELINACSVVDYTADPALGYYCGGLEKAKEYIEKELEKYD